MKKEKRGWRKQTYTHGISNSMLINIVTQGRQKQGGGGAGVAKATPQFVKAWKINTMWYLLSMAKVLINF